MEENKTKALNAALAQIERQLVKALLCAWVMVQLAVTLKPYQQDP